MPSRRVPALVGRSSELSLLRGAVDAAATGRGIGVVVHGPAGIGKTRLATEIAHYAQAIGLRVVRGSAHLENSTSPFSLALDALGAVAAPSLTDHSSSFRSLLEAGAPGAASFLITQRLLEAFDALSGSPTLLVLEDVHWADANSQQWLEQLINRVGDGPVSVIVTTRSGRFADLFEDRLLNVALGPMPYDDVTALARSALGRRPGPLLRTALDSAEGNPFAVLALIEGHDAKGGLARSSNLVELDHRSGPIGPSESITARLDRLTERHRRAIKIAAVLGRVPNTAALSIMLGVRTVDVIESFDAAVHSGVMESGDDGYRFPHQLFVDAIIALWPHDALRALHHDAARALEESGGTTIVIAEHLVRSARRDDPYTLEWIERAANETLAVAPATSLKLIDVAQGLITGRAPLSIQLVRVQALAATGRTSEAEGLARSMLSEQLSSDTEALLRRELALTYFLTGQVIPCSREMEIALDLTPEPVRRGRLRAELSFARFLALDLKPARMEALKALDEARVTDDRVAAVAATTVLCWLDLMSADLTSARQRGDDAEQLADRPGTAVAHVYQPWLTSALVRIELDDFVRAQRSISRGSEVAHRVGAAWAAAGYEGLRAFAAMRQGRLDEAATLAGPVIELDEGVDGVGVQVWCHSFLAQIALHRGELEVAEHHTAAAARQAAVGRAQVGLEQLALAEAHRSELLGDLTGALRHLALVWDLMGDVGSITGRQQIGADIVRLAVQTGDLRRAREVCSQLRDAIARTPLTSWAADLERAQSWMTADVDRARAAAARYTAAGRHLAAAAALTDVADISRTKGDHVTARRSASIASDALAALGASDSARRTRERHGVSATTTRHAHLQTLTPAERRVVELIATGKSNHDIAQQLYVSRRTVESHISSAYRKLGVRSRVGLASLVLDAPESRH